MTEFFARNSWLASITRVRICDSDNLPAGMQNIGNINSPEGANTGLTLEISSLLLVPLSSPPSSSHLPISPPHLPIPFILPPPLLIPSTPANLPPSHHRHNTQYAPHSSTTHYCPIGYNPDRPSNNHSSHSSTHHPCRAPFVCLILPSALE